MKRTMILAGLAAVTLSACRSPESAQAERARSPARAAGAPAAQPAVRLTDGDGAAAAAAAAGRPVGLRAAGLRATPGQLRAARAGPGGARPGSADRLPYGVGRQDVRTGSGARARAGDPHQA